MIRNFERMAWLLINTSDRVRFSAALLSEDGVIKERNAEGARVSVFSLLRAIVDPDELPGLRGIAVVYGPGSFSAIRSGVLVANLLSRLYHIPLYGFSKDEALNPSEIGRRLSEGSVSPSEYVSPVYDAEPNITIKEDRR